jgi:hypothetical protein
MKRSRSGAQGGGVSNEIARKNKAEQAAPVGDYQNGED